MSLCTRPVLTEHRALVLNWALSHLFLFACLNCDLYLFVQVQEEDMKESSVWSCCLWDAALCVRTEHGARVLSWAFQHLVFECFILFWMFKLARLKNTCKWSAFVMTRSSGPSTVLSVFLGWPQPVGWDRRGAPPQPWTPIIVTTFHPTSDGPDYKGGTEEHKSGM